MVAGSEPGGQSNFSMVFAVLALWSVTANSWLVKKLRRRKI
jgi:hypothetical protein